MLDRLTWSRELAAFTLGALTAGAWAADASRRRAALLNRLDIRLNGPDIPPNILDTVLGAEMRWYDELPAYRRLAEDAQDGLALLWTDAAFRANYSVGAFRIKAHTIRGLIDYAIERSYLEIRTPADSRYDKVLSYFAVQPALNRWQAAVLLAHVKEAHPVLRDWSWSRTAEDPAAIAKLYSGYMGAGGAWESWRSDMTPGPTARERLGYDEATGEYAFVVLPNPAP